MRRLLVPCVADRILQTAAARRLSRSFEEEFLESSYAYRPGRGVDRAVARVTQWRDLGFLFVVDGDIEQFFDRVGHEELLALLARQNPGEFLMGLVRQWVRAAVWDGQNVIRLRRGLAQGSPLSPLLANFFLGAFDLELEKGGNHLVRYADDFLVMCPSEPAAQEALATTSTALSGLGLKLNREKTRITSFLQGFQFLGVFFLGERVWIPWKEKRPEGKVLYAAPPMPAHLLWRYQELPASRTQMEQAFHKAGRTIAGAPARIDADAGITAADGIKGRSYVAYLYITEQGATLRKSGDRFLVEKDDRVLADLPYHKLENVLVFGHVQVTTQAMGELLERGVRLSVFSRQLRYRGSLTPAKGKNVELRLKQFELYRDEARSLGWARSVVRAKIGNGCAVLRRYARRGGKTGAMEAAVNTMEAALADLGEARDLNSLLGLEGGAARAYFGGLMSYNRSAHMWDGRKKAPAPDPLNALLSLTYTLLTHELVGLLDALGLDPHVGFLHQLDYGRPSLALDLLEPLRHPVADRFVITVVNRGMFQAGDFHPVLGDHGEGMALMPGALREFFGAYERWMIGKPGPAGSGGAEPFRQALRREVESFAGVLRDGKEWEPYPFDEAAGGEGTEEDEGGPVSLTV